MRRLWLIFAQTVTISLAVLFVVSSLNPDWSILWPLSRPSTGNKASAGNSFREAAKKALPSVVHIFTSQKLPSQQNPMAEDPLFRDFFDDEGEIDDSRKSGLGSGVIVSTDGYILTNYHVVENADQIEVALDNGKTFAAQPVGGDPETDLAVLKLDPGEDGIREFPAITLGRMDDVIVGDIVLAIGNPFGVGQTVTMGIVSALGRSHLGINTFENFIQTDAAINPGNSGGALVDAKGNLVGISTAIYSRSGGSLGIGFAIPVSTASNVLEQIVRTGAVTRGWIGIEAQEITQELAESFELASTEGALIAGVQRGGPADAAGVKPGDILLSVAVKPVKDPQAMLDLIAALKPGEKVPFTFRRNKEIVETMIGIGKRPPLRANRD